MQLAVLDLLAVPEDLPLPVRQRIDALRTYYADPQSRIIWNDEGMAVAFLDRLRQSHNDGLGSRDNLVEQLELTRRVSRFALSGPAYVAHRAKAELYWSAGFLKYAALLKKGRILPTKVDTKLFWQPKEIDHLAALQLVSELRNVNGFFDAWEPQGPLYKSLKRGLADHRAIEDAGGWERVPVIDVLRPGEQHEIVPKLRARLALTDGASAAARAGEETVFSQDLVEAVKRFQRRHGIEDDGIVGKKTLFQINIPVAQRIRQIELSLERIRWMPEDLGNDYILVNIAGYELGRFVGGELRERMRVVVGKPYHQTPVFSETMTYVELNPYWNVPRSIAVNEELPKLQSAPASRAERGFEAVIGDKPVPVTSINWNQYSRDNFPVRLRQKPGPGNALGQVKFMFPNRFNVYMHDTPARSLFSETNRAFSHGCIRLARPIDMAELVLETVPGWNRERIEQVLAGGERTVVSLASPIEVHIVYSTAWREADGTMQFRPDIYRRDAKLYAALFGQPYPY